MQFKNLFNNSHYNLHYLIEPLLLFTAFFLPGYITQGRPVDPELFNSVDFNITYILSSVPQIALLIYIIFLGQTVSTSEHTSPTTVYTGDIFKDPRVKFETYNLFRLRFVDIPLAIVAAAGIYLLLLLVSFIGMNFFPESSALENPVRWSVERTDIIPLVFLTCLITGYREELFFRSYLLKRTEMSGLSLATGVILSSLFFSTGHIYQGFLGFIGTFLIGLYFAVIFIRTKNIHIIAIAHGLFNFANLLFSTLQ